MVYSKFIKCPYCGSNYLNYWDAYNTQTDIDNGFLYRNTGWTCGDCDRDFETIESYKIELIEIEYEKD
jgi:DNA-directed RNA polymerase subunit RPC12/RpoP